MGPSGLEVQCVQGKDRAAEHPSDNTGVLWIGIPDQDVVASPDGGWESKWCISMWSKLIGEHAKYPDYQWLKDGADELKTNHDEYQQHYQYWDVSLFSGHGKEDRLCL